VVMMMMMMTTVLWAAPSAPPTRRLECGDDLLQCEAGGADEWVVVVGESPLPLDNEEEGNHAQIMGILQVFAREIKEGVEYLECRSVSTRKRLFGCPSPHRKRIPALLCVGAGEKPQRR